jgi:phage repressor protein C with HTH and peptisase S24 domain
MSSACVGDFDVGYGYKSVMDTLASRIKTARTYKGLSQQAVADHFQINRVSVTQWESDVTRPESDKIPELATLLGTTADWLLSGKGVPPISDRLSRSLDLGQATAIRSNSKPRRPADATPISEMQVFARNEMVSEQADLPVYASAKGGLREDSMIIGNEPIEYVKRPTPLWNVRDGYAVYVSGESMAPVYEHGDLVLVHPHRPSRPGSNVIIIGGDEDGTRYAVVKRLISSTSVEWHLRQFNPPPGEETDFSLNRFDWPTCHLIVGSYSGR